MRWESKRSARPYTHRSNPNLVNKYPDHITLAALQRTKSTAKVELNVVLLAFHTHSQKDAPGRVEIEPQVVHEEIAESFRVKADVFSSNCVMLSYQRTIANADHEPEGFLHGDVEGLLPCKSNRSTVPVTNARWAHTSRIEGFVYRPRLRHTMAVLVAQSHKCV